MGLAYVKIQLGIESVSFESLVKRKKGGKEKKTMPSTNAVDLVPRHGSIARSMKLV